MKINGFLIFATCCVLTVSTTSCQKIKGLFGKKKSATTGWAYNDSKNGLNTIRLKIKRQVPD